MDLINFWIDGRIKDYDTSILAKYNPQYTFAVLSAYTIYKINAYNKYASTSYYDEKDSIYYFISSKPFKHINIHDAVKMYIRYCDDISLHLLFEKNDLVKYIEYNLQNNFIEVPYLHNIEFDMNKHIMELLFKYINVSDINNIIISYLPTDIIFDFLSKFNVNIKYSYVTDKKEMDRLVTNNIKHINAWIRITMDNINILYMNIDVLSNLYGYFIYPVIKATYPPKEEVRNATRYGKPIPFTTYEVTNIINYISINDIIDNEYKIYEDDLFKTVHNTYTKLLNRTINNFHKLHTYERKTMMNLKRSQLDEIESYNKKRKYVK